MTVWYCSAKKPCMNDNCERACKCDKLWQSIPVSSEKDFYHWALLELNKLKPLLMEDHSNDAKFERIKAFIDSYEKENNK